MIRDGDVGLWPGYRARAYSMRAPSKATEAARAAIVAAEHPGATAAGPSSTSPVGKAGWAPPQLAGSAVAPADEPGVSESSV